jgi:Cu(I)/Ag(I) efflux system protein CusF
MKRFVLLISTGLLAACNASEPAPGPAPPTIPAANPPQGATVTPKVGSTTGVIESVDPGAGTMTIAHGPVDALQWPGMTMSFHASPEQLTKFKKGDRVAFEFKAQGMEGTITKIERLP